MTEQEKCCQCLLEFSMSNAPRSMPVCRHNICTKCLKQIIAQKQEFMSCAFCVKKINRKEIILFPKNTKMLEKLRLNESINSSPKLKISKNKSKLKQPFQEYPQSKEKQNLFEEENLLGDQENPICEKIEQNFMHRPIPTKTSVDTSVSHMQQMCMQHNKPLEIICVTDRKRICPHCAIFGNHKDHKFRTFVQFERQIYQRTQEFQQIENQKQTFFQSMSASAPKIQTFNQRQQLQHLINQKILQRKKMISQQVKLKFFQLLNSISSIQQSVQKQLEAGFSRTEKYIHDRICKETQTNDVYLSWQSKCKQVISKLKNTNSLQQRVQIFFQSPLEINIQGKIFLQKLIKENIDLLEHSAQKINQISLLVKDQHKKMLRDYVQLIFPKTDQNMSSRAFQESLNSFTNKIDKCHSQPQIDRNIISNNPEVIDSLPTSKGKRNLIFNQSLYENNNEGLSQNSFIFQSDISSIGIIMEEGLPKNASKYSILDETQTNPNNARTVSNKYNILDETQLNPNKMSTVSQKPKFPPTLSKANKNSTANPSSFERKRSQNRNNFIARNSNVSMVKVQKQSKRKMADKSTVKIPRQSKLNNQSCINLNFEKPMVIRKNPPLITTQKTSNQSQNRSPEQIIEQFCQNDLITELNLSNFNMSDQSIYQHMQSICKASHAFRSLKLQKNDLTDEGFQRITNLLKNIFSINLSYNSLTERSLQIILKNKDCFTKLRNINLSHNMFKQPKMMDLKAKSAMEELKRLGIMVTL